MKSNMPMRNAKTLLIIAGQIIFFALFFWYYVRQSFLRTRCDMHIEFALALVLVLAMAVNYWLLYPVFYKKHSFWLYAVVTVTEAFLVTTLEYALTIDVGLGLIIQTVSYSELIRLKLVFFFNIMTRNLCLLGFVGLMANNIGQKFRLLEKDRLMLKKENRVILRKNNEDYIIDASTICYVRQQQNETTIFTDDGQQYKRRGSMIFFEETMPPASCVRISKSTIVFCSHIQSFTDKEVTIQMKESDKNVTLPFGRYIASSAYTAIQQIMQPCQQIDNSQQTVKTDTAPSVSPDTTDSKETAPTVSDNDHQQPSQPAKKRKRNQKYSMVFHFITEHAGCNIKDIVDVTTIPKSTVSRILAELKKEGSIEYVGSKKTGGYHVADNRNEGDGVGENGIT